MPCQQILDFWFNELTPAQWWQVDEALDAVIKEKFLKIHQQAVAGELADWRDAPLGRLAEIIVIDQFSRNIYRGKGQAFAYDALALALAQEAIRSKADELISIDKVSFMYLPFMHSESLVIHQQAMQLFSREGLENNLAFEAQHKHIIDKFGRYPHRNIVMQRQSTAEEVAFLKEPNSSF